jgi:hypothetical protein
MIGRIHKRGRKVGGLMRYLFGPGKREEHIEPRIVSGWLDPSELQPVVNADGVRDFRPLIGELEKPVIGADVDFAKRVWHCSLRNAGEDWILTDTEWDGIAREVMSAVGLSGDGEKPGVRWVAVRHNDDHIHIVATLVREDGRIEKAWNDQYKLRAVCQELERKYGLVSTAPADRTAPRRPALAEISKAERAGRKETWRDQLRREVRIAVAASKTPEEFIQRLRGAGVMVKVRHSSIDPAEMTGYAVALPGHKSRGGELVYYSGGNLAADLSLPKLRQRWDTPNSATLGAEAGSASRGGREERTRLLHQAQMMVDRATEEITCGGSTGWKTTGSLASASSDIVATVVKAHSGAGDSRLWSAAEGLDRAVREPHGRPVSEVSAARRLRAVSQQLAQAGRLSGHSDREAARRLMHSLARLSDSVAELRRAQQRLHQADDALRASVVLREHAATGPQSDASAPSPAAGRSVTAPRTPVPQQRQQYPRSR